MKKSNLKPIDIVFAILGSISILIFVIHYSSFYIHAENSYFPMGQNDNNYFNEQCLSFINTQYDTENYLVFVKYGGLVNGGSQRDYYVCRIPKANNMLYAEIYSNGYQFSIYKEGISNVQVQRFRQTISNNSCSTYSNSASFATLFQGLTSSKYSTSYGYVSNFMLYKNANKDTIVLRYGEAPFEPAQGHATQNNFDNNDNITSTGHAQQPSTPTFPTFPTITIDTTNVESLLESIFNIIDSIGDFVGECFSVFFSWVVSVLQNGFQSIVNTIRDFADSFYNNMLSLFEPIATNIEYLVQPISSTIIYDNISSTSLVTNINSIETSINIFVSSFNYLNEPSSYTIPIHLENLPSNYFGNLSTQYIDLGVLNPVKTALRTFMWALTTFGLFITIVDSISNYINGGQDE